MLKIFKTTYSGKIAVQTDDITKIRIKEYPSDRNEAVLIFGNGVNAVEFWISSNTTLLDLINFIESDEVEYKGEVD